MYLEHFGFSGEPFKLTPDPRFFFGSKSHNKAMAYLHYGLRQGDGFIVITGEIGAGKSMLITHLLDQIDRTNVVAADLITPNLKPDELLPHILSAFRVEPAQEGPTADIEAFEDFLFDQMNRGRRVLLIVDEAQNLPRETLEELRVLSNLDYDGTPLFQVFLIGQPDFRPIISGDGMEQLRQRIIASYHLEPLTAEDVKAYVEHRLSVVGWSGDRPRISEDVYGLVHKATDGVPRRINKLFNRILLFSSIEGHEEVTGAIVRSVVRDIAEEDVTGKTTLLPETDDAPANKPAPVRAPDKEPPAMKPTQASRANGRDHDASVVDPPPLAAPQADRSGPRPNLRLVSAPKPAPGKSKGDAGLGAGAGGKGAPSAPVNTPVVKGKSEKAPPPPKATPPERTTAGGPSAENPDAENAGALDDARTNVDPFSFEDLDAAPKPATPAVEAGPAVPAAATVSEASKNKATTGRREEEPMIAPTEQATAAVPASVFDRVRARKAAEKADDRVSGKGGAKTPPRPATLLDVASAIEAETGRAAPDAKPATFVRADEASEPMAPQDDLAGHIFEAEPAVAIPPNEAERAIADAAAEASGVEEMSSRWREALNKTVVATSADLQSAHDHLARLRRKLTAAEDSRRKTEEQISERLTRAETLLAEIRDAWR